jgi:small-conductance mechanosensitive channel
MFRDLRERVSPTRRVAAWVLLGLFLVAGALWLPRASGHPALIKSASVLVWGIFAYAAVRLVSFVLLDPLFSQRTTATPGFARDMLVVGLYVFAIGGILKEVLGVSLGQLLGTGAIAAAVVGLSLQETLGNLFTGISLHLDPAFQEGDWVEISGNIRGGSRRETFIGQVEAMTWRSVQIRTEDGDMDIFPNRIIAQAIVTNLYVPSGLHRRTAKVVVEPHPELHVALQKLTIALAGVPHYTHHQPAVVVWGSDLGGAILEARFWGLGFRHSRAATFHATRLMTTVLPREGFSLLGPHGPTTPHPPIPEPDQDLMRRMVGQLKLPEHWIQDLRPFIQLRRLAPEEGVIREGDPGESLFAVLEGQLRVVRVVERDEPYTGLFWETVALLEPGQWFGEASLLTGAPRNATVISVTPCLLMELPKAAFEASLKREPEVLECLVDLMELRNPEIQPGTEAHLARRQAWLHQIKHWFSMH